MPARDGLQAADTGNGLQQPLAADVLAFLILNLTNKQEG
jgi:hypothetical protein